MYSPQDDIHITVQGSGNNAKVGTGTGEMKFCDIRMIQPMISQQQRLPAVGLHEPGTVSIQLHIWRARVALPSLLTNELLMDSGGEVDIIFSIVPSD